MENVDSATNTVENTDSEENTNKNTEVETDNAENKPAATKTYTEEEMLSIVDSRISKAYTKWNKEKTKAVEEANKLAQMTADEKAKYEVEQMKSEYENKLKDLAIKENLATCTSILADKGIDPRLAKYCVAETAEEMNDKIKEFESYFKASVRKEVEKRLNSTTPKENAGTEREGLTKEQFNKLSLSEQFKIGKENPELYNKMVG